MADARWVVGIDVGGTFTDAIATSTDGQVRVAKVPSTPADPGLAFEQALAELAATGITPASILMIFHGTTVATNALLTGSTARVVLATTAGFRDVLGYRNGSRPEVYDLTQPRPRQLVSRRDRFEVTERLSGLGEVVTPLTAGEVERVAERVAQARPEAVAVCLLFSYLDDTHEQMLGDAIAKKLPDVPVTVSADVAREFREYPRTSTTVINAALRPVVGNYLLKLTSRLGPAGSAPPLQIMQSNGGCLPADRAAQQAHRLVLSGRPRASPARSRSAPATASGSSSRSTWAARRSTSAWCRTASRPSSRSRRSTRARSWPRRSTSSRSERAAAASPGSTGRAGSASARRARAPHPGPRPTAAGATAPR